MITVLKRKEVSRLLQVSTSLAYARMELCESDFSSIVEDDEIY